MTPKRSEGSRRAPPRPTATSSGSKLPAASLEPDQASSANVEGFTAWRASERTSVVQVVVRVTEANYVPDFVQIRARISSVMFTAQLPATNLERLQHDPRVASVGFPRSVHPADR